jgi:ABC-type transport system substrate-binding protein
LDRALEGLRASGYEWKKEPTVGPNDENVHGVGLTILGREPAPLTVLTSGGAYDPARPIYAREIADTLGELGFDVRPVETDFDTVVDLAFTAGDDGNLHHDMYLLGWTLGSPLLPNYHRPLFSEDGPENNTGYAGPDFAALLAEYERNTRSMKLRRSCGKWR